jgi:tetratricopeptide (TPR) repeat protein
MNFMDGKSIHLREEKARENGEYLEALKLSDEALISYQKEGNIVGLTEILCARFLIFQHLYEIIEDKNFLILAKFNAKSAVVIARKSDQKEALAIPLFNLGKAYFLKEKYDKATEKYKEALDALPDSPQNKPSVEADIKVHLSISEFKNGDKEAILRAENTVSDLKNLDENKYEKDVWISGGYMKIAEALYSTNAQKAREFLQKSKTVIDANPDLKLRKEQLQRLEAKLQ